jgi:hypothetical protein
MFTDVLVLHVDTGKDTVSPSPTSNNCVLTPRAVLDHPGQFEPHDIRPITLVPLHSTRSYPIYNPR